MHPDAGAVITDAALQDAEYAETTFGSEANASPRSNIAPAGLPRPGAQFGLQAGMRSRALASTATPPSSVSQGSVRSSASGASTASEPRSVKQNTKKRASPVKKSKFASVLAEKHDILFRMNRMGTRGGKQSRPMTVNDSLEELRCECERMQREIETDKSVKFQRSLMTSFATGVECLNARWNFAGLKLDGWSQSIQDDLDNYDEVFEELHAKYATKSTMPPEIKLVMMVASSAFMFHMSKSMFSTVPGMEEAMRDDPELARAVAAAVAKKAHVNETSSDRRGMTGMFANIMGQGARGGAAAAAAATPAGAVGRPMSPPDSLAGVERLFSDDSGSDAGDESDKSVDSQTQKSFDGSMIMDAERGLLLDT